ncbi:hypothetical protein JVT61DRAFT_9906 [Boletus reticuloceps]|uniref:Uncharacterized protein n=1 Tax=Boletus reticuloceps TaxID=495285 RepID=A0A8I2YFG5_9AGAM|nr:hypothetical protein JVT61DRAFT_9906 [Boletus reticuloceps]
MGNWSSNTGLNKDMSYPSPSTISRSNSFTNESLVKYTVDVCQMLYVTSLEWLEGGAVKKVETLIKQTIFYSLCKSDCELLLATTEGWSLRVTLGDILKVWDSFCASPTDRYIDQERLLKKINGETKGNKIAHMRCINDICAQNISAVKKAASLVLVDKLGLLLPGTISESIAKPLHELCEVMMIQSEKHLIHLNHPAKDITKVILHSTCLAEIRLECMPEFPTIATAEVENTFWMPIKDQDTLKKIMHLNLAQSTDHKILDLVDLKDEEVRMKIAYKVQQEKSNLRQQHKLVKAGFMSMFQHLCEWMGTGGVSHGGVGGWAGCRAAKHQINNKGATGLEKGVGFNGHICAPLNRHGGVTINLGLEYTQSRCISINHMGGGLIKGVNNVSGMSLLASELENTWLTQRRSAVA